MNWINTKDKLPDYEQPVLVVFGKDVVIAQMISTTKDGNNWESLLSNYIFDKSSSNHVQCWMPLPKPPKK